MTTLTIARHGETDWNAEGRFQGHADPPLNARGRVQAAVLAARLAEEPPYAALYASDLRRAFETATILGRRVGLEPRPEAGLREIDVGNWSGMTREEIEAAWPGSLARWATGEDAHTGETRPELAARVESTVLTLAARHRGQRLLLVAHGGVIRSLQRIVLGAPEPVVDNCATWHLAVRSGVLVAE
jgi:probable phosphoglycerate mutase